MRRLLSYAVLWGLLVAPPVLGDPWAPEEGWAVWLEPVELGVRLDDNVHRTDLSSGRRTDVAYQVDGGAGLEWREDIFRAVVGYRLSTDQYQVYSTLNDQKHQGSLFLSAEPEDVLVSYKFGLHLRNSRDPDFDYLGQDHRVTLLWTPPGHWGYEAGFGRSSKWYFDRATEYRSRDFLDNSFTLGVQREIGDRFSVGLAGSCNLREFNRGAVDALGSPRVPWVNHLDETWGIRLHARLFFASVLQDVALEQQRTESNSHGFSNTARSLSWAAVVRPADQLYLQLLGRVYWKAYDVPPIPSPGLQVGFVDEDSQEVLSVRATWELAPQWMLNLGAARVRNEASQPGVFYIKNLFTFQVRREF